VSVHIREVHDADDPALTAFGKLQREVYYEPDALIPGEWLGRLLQWQSGERQNFVLVAERDGEVLGGTVFHYLAAAASGFSSFMGVALKARGQGIARQLHEARLEVLDRAAGGHVDGMFIDVVNPTRMSGDELAHEQAVGSDPWLRRRIFGRLGFRQVDVRYEQPVGGPDGGPVTILDLMYYPPGPADSVATQLVANTMRAYWSPWLGEERAEREVRKLEQRANGKRMLPLLWPEPARV
jgi:GNAT superfamily N-acetyltransferase